MKFSLYYIKVGECCFGKCHATFHSSFMGLTSLVLLTSSRRSVSCSAVQKNSITRDKRESVCAKFRTAPQITELLEEDKILFATRSWMASRKDMSRRLAKAQIKCLRQTSLTLCVALKNDVNNMDMDSPLELQYTLLVRTNKIAQWAQENATVVVAIFCWWWFKTSV